jgi:hypothetical protein
LRHACKHAASTELAGRKLTLLNVVPPDRALGGNVAPGAPA